MSQRKFRTGIYGRTSKDDDRKVSIDTQQKTLRDWLLSDPLAIPVDEYWDPNVSGKIPIWERPAGSRLIEDLKSGSIDAVAVAYADRFGRTLLDGLQAVKEMESLGAKLTCVSEGWDARRNDSPLYMQFRFMIAEEEHRRIRERMEGGKAKAILRDNAPPGGSLTFGYQVDSKGHFVLDEIEAPLVISIFERFLSGETIADLLRWLNTSGVSVGQKYQKRGAEKVSVRKGHEHAIWTRAKIWKILHNETYLGVRKWKGQRFPCVALIDDISFRKVQELFAVRERGTNQFDPEKSLMSGLFKCSLCGSKYYAHTQTSRVRNTAWHVYSCSNHRIKRPGQSYCPARQVPINWLDGQVWGLLEQYLRDPEGLIRKVIAADSNRSANVGELDQSIDECLKSLAAIDSQAVELLAEQQTRGWPLSWITPKMDGLMTMKHQEEARLKDLRRRHAAETFSREDSSRVLAEVARLRVILDKGLTVHQKAAFIRSVWAGGLIMTTGERWKRKASIHFEFKWGELAVTPSVPQNQCQGTQGVASIGLDLAYG